MQPIRHLTLALALGLGLVSPVALAQTPPAKAPAAAAQPAGPPRARSGPVRNKQKTKKEPQKKAGPVAMYPGFRMMPDGSSRVFVQVDQKADITESKAEGRLVYRIKGAQAIKTNRHPLVTAFFPTPVAKVQLVEQGDDLATVIDLRQPSAATYRVVEMDQGIVLQIDFPALAGVTSAASLPQTVQRGKAAPARDAEDAESAGGME